MMPRASLARRAVRGLLLVVAVLAAVSAAVSASYTPAAYDYGPRAAAHAASRERFQFVALGDFEDEAVGFEDLLRRIAEEGRPDFGVVLGDVARRNARARESYLLYLDVLRRVRPSYPVLSIPGNHDRPDEGAPDEYLAAFGPLNWWFVHEGCLLVGLDDAELGLTDEARATLDAARASTDDARRVFVFLHVPVYGDAVEPGAEPTRREAAARAAGHQIRERLGRAPDAIFAAHTAAWTDQTDEHGTRHVCAGAEPGLEWPATATPQIAALCTVGPDGFEVEELRVPYRTNALAEARRSVLLYVHHRLRRYLGPVPVWLAALLAGAGWLLLRPRPERGPAARPVRPDASLAR